MSSRCTTAAGHDSVITGFVVEIAGGDEGDFLTRGSGGAADVRASIFGADCPA